MKIDLSLFEPITYDNIHLLQPGDWIWDNKDIVRWEHKRTLKIEKPNITEPIGFRQIDILDLKDFGTWWNDMPFMLTDIDNRFTPDPRNWVRFEEGRFYMFKSKQTRVAYVCDQRYCPDGCHNPDCHLTEDITHAKNFTKLEAGKWMEKFEEE